MKERLEKKSAIWLAPMIITMIGIFLLSNQSFEVSHSVSHTVAKAVSIETTYDWEDASGVPLAFGLTLRKYAHVAVFGVLGFFAMGFFRRYPIVMLVCAAYAVFDEIHQSFVPGRGASTKDVLLDIVGVLIGIVIWNILQKALLAWRKR